jgi:hypothetical protein
MRRSICRESMCRGVVAARVLRRVDIKQQVAFLVEGSDR